jgi:hypothetical protein
MNSSNHKEKKTAKEKSTKATSKMKKETPSKTREYKGS